MRKTLLAMESVVLKETFWVDASRCGNIHISSMLWQATSRTVWSKSAVRYRREPEILLLALAPVSRGYVSFKIFLARLRTTRLPSVSCRRISGIISAPSSGASSIHVLILRYPGTTRYQVLYSGCPVDEERISFQDLEHHFQAPTSNRCIGTFCRV